MTAISFFTDDRSPRQTFTTRQIEAGARTLGYRTYLRDAGGISSFASLLDQYGYPTERQVWESICATKDDYMNTAAEITHVFSLGSTWAYPRQLDHGEAPIRQFISLWDEDPHPIENPGFPEFRTPPSYRERLASPSVHHWAMSPSSQKTLEALGFHCRGILSPAAPASSLKDNTPCECSKALFTGNPGSLSAPSPEISKLIQATASTGDIRTQALAEIKPMLANLAEDLIRAISLCAEQKAASPEKPALDLLSDSIGNEGIQQLVEKRLLTQALRTINAVLQYDRAALVTRLVSKGLADVVGCPKLWEPYGIKATASPPFYELPSLYRKYAAHINTYNPIVEASSNARLFEAAACGRAVYTLHWSPADPALPYPATPEFTNPTELEEALAQALSRPNASEPGESLREHISREHLWPHRLSALINSESQDKETAPSL